jgi:hypothetical protein
MRVQRPRSSPSPPHSPPTRRLLGIGRLFSQLGCSALLAAAFASCSSGTRPAAGMPATARPISSFGESLSLALSLGSALRAGDTAVTANFALTNMGSAVFDGCFGQSWGVSVIVGGHYAGYDVSVDHPRCDEKLRLLSGQTIVWSKKVPLSELREGTAKVTGWVKVIDPATCAERYGCREISVATRLMTLAVGAR